MTSFDEHAWRYAGWRVALASAVGVFFASAIVYGFGVLLTPLATDLAWSRERASIAYACFAGAAALASPTLGWLLDRHGPVRVVIPSLALCGLGLASLSVLTASPVHVYSAFTVLGLAAAGSSPLAYSRAVSTWFDARRGLALAIVICGAAMASMIHPPLIRALVDYAGWRGACVAVGLLVVVVGVPIVSGFVREREAAQRGAVTIDGSTVFEAARTWIFWILIGVVAAAALAFNAIVVHAVALLTDRGVTADRAAIAVSVMGASGLAGRLLTGWLLDRFRATHVSAVVLSIAAGGIALLSTAASLESAVVALALIGFGMGGELDVPPYLLSRYFGLRSLATLYGCVWMTMGAGAVIGVIAMGRAFDEHGSYETALIRLAMLTLGAAVVMLALPTPRVLLHAQPVRADLSRSTQPE